VFFKINRSTGARSLLKHTASFLPILLYIFRCPITLQRSYHHIPFSRSLRLTTADAVLIRQIYEECIAQRGVLLIQPEHILSFKLMAVGAVLAGQGCAQSLLDTQEFFDRVSRDIVDESDENFSIECELVYTILSQRSISLDKP
jgi:hypothetical protein